MSAPVCAQCKHGTITQHSSGDRCAHTSNTQAFHPFALRHDATLCGPGASWYEAKPVPSAIYKAADAVKVP